MSFFSRNGRTPKAKPSQQVRSRPARFRPQLEILEDRWLPSHNTFTVTSTADPLGPSGTVSLRDAINAVNNDSSDTAGDPDHINFAIVGTPTITLTANLPALTNPVLIDGTTQAGVTVNGNGFAVLVVNSAATVQGVTLTDGPLTVNAGGSLSVTGDFTLGDAAGDNTLVQNHGSLSISGNVFAADNTGLNNYSGATFQVGGAYTAGQDSYVYDYGTAAFSVTGDFSLGDYSFVYNGLSGTDAATFTVGGSFTMGVNSYVYNYGLSSFSVTGDFTLGDNGFMYNGADFTSTDKATFTVGGGFSIGTNGFVYNDGTSAISVADNFTLGDFGYFYNGLSTTDASTLNVGGSFSIGAGTCYVYNYGTSAIKVTHDFSLGNGGFVYNGVFGSDAATMTVGGNFTVGVSGGGGTFVYNTGASKLDVTGNFTLYGVNSFVYNGESSSDTATFTVGGNFSLDANSYVYDYGTSALTVAGSFTMGASSYFVDYGTISVSGAFDPGTGNSFNNDVVAGTFNADSGSSVTTDAATWDVLAGGQLNVAAGATLDVASGGSLMVGGTFTAESGSSVTANTGTFEVLAGGQLNVAPGAGFDVASGGTLMVDGGVVTGATVTDGGSGYTSPPAVSFSGTGTGAAGVATITGGVTAVDITNGGSNYVSPVVALYGDGTGATADATVTDGVITGVTITNPGSGYTSPPFVYIYDNGYPYSGSGATGVATITGAVTAVAITNAGSGYTSAPSVSFAGDGTGAAANATVNTTSPGVVTDQGTLTVEGTLASSKLSTVVVDYNGQLSASGAGQLNIQGTLLTWNNPADITSGTALGTTQLNATATSNGSTLAGTFTYTLADDTTPANGAVLSVGNDQTLNVTFTPDDTTDYSSASAQVSINVTSAGTAPTITSGNSTTFTVGTAGTFTVTTTGSPTPTLSETDALPGGVTFTDNGNGTATLAGTPSTASGGTYSFTITAHNGVGNDASQAFTLTVNEAPSITSANATTFTVGSAGNFTVTASGFPAPTFSESNTDTLPSGVTFNTSTGALSGTPAVATGGTYTLHFTAHNGVGSDATQTFTLTVNQAAAFTSANATTFTVGSAGNFTVTASGFPAPTFSESNTDTLPSGVTFNTSTGALSGTPAVATGGTYTLHFTAHNGVGNDASQAFTLTVKATTPPTVATAAKANPSPVTGSTTSLSVLGADAAYAAGEASLTYNWTVTSEPAGATTPTFSINGTNASKNTTATFYLAGPYTFQVTIADPAGLTVTSSVNVTVNQTLTSIGLSPATVTLADKGQQQFTATAFDQFSHLLASQPAFTWLIASGGVGQINNSGNYTGPNSGTGTATVLAKSGSITGTARVTISYFPPVITQPASSNQNPVTGTATQLQVQASDPNGANLTYTWSVTNQPNGATTPTFNNANNNSTSVTFYQSGSYTFLVTVKDTLGQSSTSSVTVSVVQTLSSLSITPASVTLAEGATQQFTAAALDQFGQAMASQPSFTWQVSGGGTISSTGLYTAPNSTGNFQVKVSANGKSATANVAVTTIPAAPSNLTAQASLQNGSAQVKLHWNNNSNNQTGFVVQRYSNGMWTTIATLTGNPNNYTDTTAAPGTTYEYRVYAYNVLGNSPYSNVVTVTTP